MQQLSAAIPQSCQLQSQSPPLYTPLNHLPKTFVYYTRRAHQAEAFDVCRPKKLNEFLCQQPAATPSASPPLAHSTPPTLRGCFSNWKKTRVRVRWQ